MNKTVQYRSKTGTISPGIVGRGAFRKAFRVGNN
jgi:hypothetical protein